jgi:hypothetical protein
MKLTPTAEQRLTRETLDGLLGGLDTAAAGRSWVEGDPAAGLRIWGRLAEFGVTGLMVDAEFNGMEADAGHLVMAFHQIGYHAAPGPYIESAAAVPALLRALAIAELSEEWLPALAAGERIATYARDPLVPLAADADHAMGVFMIHGDELLLCPPLPSIKAQPGLDSSRRMFHVDPEAGLTLASGEGVDRARRAAEDAGMLAAAAMLVGTGEHLLKATCEYATQRTQFGRPIGSFQAVKHQLADIAVAIAFARPLLYQAAISLDEGLRDAGLHVAMAKLRASQAAAAAARAALQVHGATGYTSELDLSLWLRKAWAWERAWGSPTHLRDVIARALGLTATAELFEETGSR